MTFSLSALHVNFFPIDSLLKKKQNKKNNNNKADNKYSLKFGTKRVSRLAHDDSITQQQMRQLCSQVLLRRFLITYNSAATNQKTSHIWYGGTWKGSLPFYIYEPLGHALGRS